MNQRLEWFRKALIERLRETEAQWTDDPYSEEVLSAVVTELMVEKFYVDQERSASGGEFITQLISKEWVTR